MTLWGRQVSWALSPHSQEGAWPRAPASLNGRGTDYSSQVPTGRAGAAAAAEHRCARAAGSCSRGWGEDGVQGERGAAAGEEYRGAVLPLRAQRGEHQVRGLRGRPWPRPALSGLRVCKTTAPSVRPSAASRAAG